MTERVRDDDLKRQAMLDRNLQQRAFYDTPSHQRGNVITGLWRRARRSLYYVRDHLQTTALIEQHHRKWLGDLADKRVLDLGCYGGNPLSLEIARQSASYLGLDLSAAGIIQLQQQLEQEHLPLASTQVGDFLALDFPYPPFDVVYAVSVLHHFEHFDTVLKLLHARIVPGGSVITTDPLNTCWSIRFARHLYRPFQSDAAWEWPFTQQSLVQIERYFHIEAVQGVMGYAKWAVPLAMLPYGRGLALRVGQRLHVWDQQVATHQGPGLWRCLQVAMHLRRRDG
jgi:2-polyprenyl-3-methyl-5-hydroxy-6-metoxy-1,4-benzoquinol methylase